MSIHLDIKGLDKVLRGLDERKLNTMMRNAMDGAVKELQAEMMIYPPKPPDSKYRRTDTLKHAWTGKVTGSGKPAWLGVVGNRVKYARYVQDETEQATIHRKTWAKHTVQAVAKDKMDYCVNLIQAKINEWIARM